MFLENQWGGVVERPVDCAVTLAALRRSAGGIVS